MFLLKPPKFIFRLAVLRSAIFSLILLSIVSVVVVPNDAYAAIPDQVQNMRADELTHRYVALAWDPPANTSANYEFKLVYADAPHISILSGSSTIPNYWVDNLASETDYLFWVQPYNDDGQGVASTFAFTTLANESVVIDEVSFSTSGPKILTVTGTDIADESSYIRYAATLNGVGVPICSINTGATAEQFVSILGVAPEMVSDLPTCILFFNDTPAYNFFPDKVQILLSDDFDISARGTLSLNNSAPFVFNESAVPDNDQEEETPAPAQPISEPSNPPVTSKPPAITTMPLIDGLVEEVFVPSVVSKGTQLENESTIEKRPTFSGKAAPFSVVTVTVRSDPVSCTTTADANGDWSCTLPQDLPAGQHTVTVAMTTPENETMQLGPYMVTVEEEKIQPVTTLASAATPIVQPTEANTAFPWPWVIGAGIVAIVIAALALAYRHLKKAQIPPLI
jgi:hypothetical protein